VTWYVRAGSAAPWALVWASAVTVIGRGLMVNGTGALSALV